jgi:hypothetical protein
MIVKKTPLQLDRIRKILEDQHGTLLTSDLARSNIPRTYLSIMERNGEIERVARGVYKRLLPIMMGIQFQSIHRTSVYSQTALYLHDMTDRLIIFSSFRPVGYHSISLTRADIKYST